VRDAWFKKASIITFGMMIMVLSCNLPSLASAQQELFVSATVEGTLFTASSAGTYRFTIIGGACQV